MTTHSCLLIYHLYDVLNEVLNAICAGGALQMRREFQSETM